MVQSERLGGLVEYIVVHFSPQLRDRSWGGKDWERG